MALRLGGGHLTAGQARHESVVDGSWRYEAVLSVLRFQLYDQMFDLFLQVFDADIDAEVRNIDMLLVPFHRSKILFL